jgi:hypothetical protein
MTPSTATCRYGTYRQAARIGGRDEDLRRQRKIAVCDLDHIAASLRIRVTDRFMKPKREVKVHV